MKHLNKAYIEVINLKHENYSKKYVKNYEEIGQFYKEENYQKYMNYLNYFNDLINNLHI